jgi:hypothetical protein
MGFEFFGHDSTRERARHWAFLASIIMKLDFALPGVIQSQTTKTYEEAPK